MEKRLRKLQLCQLDLALEVKRICEKNNIRYFLIGGTLLGAVRHNGFIPWDDDLDIGMLRDEYNKFVEVCKRDLNSDYFLEIFDENKDFGFLFAKLRINNTTFIESVSNQNNTHKGIYIDIFPFDNMPVDEKAQIKQSRKVRMFRNFLLIKCKYNHWDDNDKKMKIIKKILFFMLKPFSKKYLFDKVYKNETMYNNEKCNNYINLEGSYRYKEYLPVRCIEDLSTVDFEGEKFTIPSNAEYYLTNLYGDYMKLPPEDKRGNRHNIQKLSFGTYNIKNNK